MSFDRNVPSDVLRLLVAMGEVKGRSSGPPHNDNGQSSAGTRVDVIADTIGEPLFMGTRSGTVLTEAGQQLLDAARRILADNDAQLKMADAVQASDHVRLGISSMLLGFLVDQPGATLPANMSVRSDICSRIVRAFDEEEVDVAMVLDVRDHRQTLGSNLVAEFDIEFAWMKAESFALEPQMPIPLATWPPDQHIILNALCESDTPYTILFTGPDYASKFTAVRSGKCVAVVPRHAIAPPLLPVEDSHLPPIAPKKILLAVRGDPQAERFKAVVSLLSAFPLDGGREV
jgi:DNA-binding transcriptional LysR family regulator